MIMPMKIYKLTFFSFVLSALLFEYVVSYGQNTTDSNKNVKPVFVKDNPIVAMLDSLAKVKPFDNAMQITSASTQNNYKFTPGFVPSFTDSVYTARIAKLNSKSPFGLRYNKDVKSFIDLYAVKKRYLTSRMLGLAQVYFPLFEEQLDKYKLPLELKYLAVVESALNPEAHSWAGASGLWQFIYSTGKQYGLQVTSYVDDRSDPLKETIAACEHFRDLFAIYGDWSLVLAAYNSGPGNVNRAIRKAGGDMDFWKIQPYLPKETQGYVPAFIAVVYVMNYASEHNIFPVLPKILYNDIDTVTVTQTVSLSQVGEFLNIPKEDLEFLNPCFKLGIIPATADEVFQMRLPKNRVGDFLNNEKAIYAFKTKEQIKQEELLAKKKLEMEKKINQVAVKDTNTIKTPENTSSEKIHIVKAGEGLGVIASKYNCTVTQLQEWNNLKNQNIFPGQKLYIQPQQKVVVNNEVKENRITNNNNNQKAAKYIYHTVQKGDTLWGIANKYKGVSVEQIKRLNNLGEKYNLFPGQKLKIAIAG